MIENPELKKIKKVYGEAMAHFCRDNFATILETPGKLYNILSSTFNECHYLYNDLLKYKMISKFKEFIYTKCFINDNKFVEINKNPHALMNEAGYILTECKSEREIQAFKKYYAHGEELCTFNGNRLDKCYVYFAVKKNVDEIRRENFKNPSREDLYGTSVISIQFTKDITHTLSIKNRYNHVVVNPDATYSNNLENIIPGLTESFNKYYGMKQMYASYDIDIPGYVKASDGLYYKYNMEINNVYYCPDNIIIENFQVTKYPKEKYIVMDNFILDLVNKEITIKTVIDAFISFIGKIKKVSIINGDNDKKIMITNDNNENTEITLDKFNNIIEIKNNDIKRIGNYFTCYNNSLKKITLDSVDYIGKHFLQSNNVMESLNLPTVKMIDDSFMFDSETLKSISCPKLESIGYRFMYTNDKIVEINFPALKEIDRNFLYNNKSVNRINLPRVEKIGNGFLLNTKNVNDVYMPKLKYIGLPSFLRYNNSEEYDLGNCTNRYGL